MEPLYPCGTPATCVLWTALCSRQPSLSPTPIESFLNYYTTCRWQCRLSRLRCGDLSYHQSNRSSVGIFIATRGTVLWELAASARYYVKVICAITFVLWCHNDVILAWCLVRQYQGGVVLDLVNSPNTFSWYLFFHKRKQYSSLCEKFCVRN